MTIQRHRSNEQAQQQGTRQRVAACRKRLRRRRALQKAFKLAQDEAVVAAATELQALVPDEADFLAGEDAFNGTGASTAVAGRRFTPEVDRRARLRAR